MYVLAARIYDGLALRLTRPDACLADVACAVVDDASSAEQVSTLRSRYAQHHCTHRWQREAGSENGL